MHLVSISQNIRNSSSSTLLSHALGDAAYSTNTLKKQLVIMCRSPAGSAESKCTMTLPTSSQQSQSARRPFFTSVCTEAHVHLTCSLSQSILTICKFEMSISLYMTMRSQA